MSILRKLFHDDHPTDTAVACPHPVLTPRWDGLDDMGDEELATSFRCARCGVTFAGEEGRRLLREPLTAGAAQ